LAGKRAVVVPFHLVSARRQNQIHAAAGGFASRGMAGGSNRAPAPDSLRASGHGPAQPSSPTRSPTLGKVNCEPLKISEFAVTECTLMRGAGVDGEGGE
jgi:hypothetical protein